MNSAMEQSGLNQTQVDHFQTDGFLLVEDFFTQSELDGFGVAVDAAVAYRTSDDDRDVQDKSLYEQTFVQCMRLWEDSPEVSPFTFHAKLCAAAAALLRTECVRLWHDQALYKEPGGRKTDAHLDYPFWPLDRQDLVSVWIPFDDVGNVTVAQSVMAEIQKVQQSNEELGLEDVTTVLTVIQRL